MTGSENARIEHEVWENLLITLREAVVLAEVSERAVRKDIDKGLLAAPIIMRRPNHRVCTYSRYVITLAAVYGNTLLTGSQRKFMLTKFESMPSKIDKAKDKCASGQVLRFIELDKYVSLNFGKVYDYVSPRVSLYVAGLQKIDKKPDVLGGTAVFKGTRLPVHHVGKMYDAGETIENIISDYPYLNRDDIEFSKLYYHAHPAVGRPRINTGSASDDVPPTS